MKVPGFLVKKVYVKGSLKNSTEGLQLCLKNVLGNGTLIGVNEVTVDGAAYGPDKVTLTSNGQTRMASTVSPENPFPLPVKTEVQICVMGVKIVPGEHKFAVKMKIKELGEIVADLKDTMVE